MITCDKCGTQMPDDSIACPGCGAAIAPLEAAESDAATTVADDSTTAVTDDVETTAADDVKTTAVAAPAAKASAAAQSEYRIESVSRPDPSHASQSGKCAPPAR